MSDLSDNNDAWQVDVKGRVYEASFSELADWIDGGSLQPQDMVRRGNLRWIEAHKVPKLVPFFQAKASGSWPPVALDSTSTDGKDATELAQTSDINGSAHLPVQDGQELDVDAYSYQPQSSTSFDGDYCSDHIGVPAKFVCRSCKRPSCAECINRFGSSVALCKAC